MSVCGITKAMSPVLLCCVLATMLRGYDGDSESIAWLRQTSSPPPRFVEHVPRFSAQRLRRHLPGGGEGELIVLYDHDRAIGLWNQGDRPWERRFHLLTHDPAGGLDGIGLESLLQRHWCRWGYDVLWSPGGMVFSVGPWFPNAEKVVDEVVVEMGGESSRFQFHERTRFHAKPEEHQPECLISAELTIWVDPVHGYRLSNAVQVETRGLFGTKRRKRPARIMPFTPTVGGVQDIWHGRVSHDMTLYVPPGQVAPNGALTTPLPGHAHNPAVLRGMGSPVDPSGFVVMVAAASTVDGPWSIAVTSNGDWQSGPCPLMLEMTTGAVLPPVDQDGWIRFRRHFGLMALPPEMGSWLRKHAELQSGKQERAIMLPVGRHEDFESQPWSTTTTSRGVLVLNAVIDPGAGRNGSRCLRFGRSSTIAASPSYPVIRLDPESSYRLRAWARTSTAMTTARIQPFLKTWNAPKERLPPVLPATTVSEAWQRVDITFDTDASDLATEMRLRFELEGEGQLLIDDFFLEQVP